MKWLKEYLRRTYAPDHYARSLAEAIAMIDRPNVLLDLDNTLVFRKRTDVADEILKALDEAVASGRVKKVCIISNVGYPRWFTKKYSKLRDRVAFVAEIIGALFHCATWPWLKPWKRPFLKAMIMLGGDPEDYVMVGDQLMTDILGAKRMGIKTILVPALGKDNLLTVLSNRWREWLVLWYLELKPQTAPGS